MTNELNYFGLNVIRIRLNKVLFHMKQFGDKFLWGSFSQQVSNFQRDTQIPI
jgi:hypothetical protein